MLRAPQLVRLNSPGEWMIAVNTQVGNRRYNNGLAALQANAILPEGYVLSFQALPQLRGEWFAISASVGDEDARRNACVRARISACYHADTLR